MIDFVYSSIVMLAPISENRKSRSFAVPRLTRHYRYFQKVSPAVEARAEAGRTFNSRSIRLFKRKKKNTPRTRAQLEYNPIEGFD